jgi:hypothetical protein
VTFFGGLASEKSHLSDSAELLKIGLSLVSVSLAKSYLAVIRGTPECDLAHRRQPGTDLGGFPVLRNAESHL